MFFIRKQKILSLQDAKIQTKSIRKWKEEIFSIPRHLFFSECIDILMNSIIPIFNLMQQILRCLVTEKAKEMQVFIKINKQKMEREKKNSNASKRKCYAQAYMHMFNYYFIMICKSRAHFHNSASHCCCLMHRFSFNDCCWFQFFCGFLQIHNQTQNKNQVW